MVIGMLSIKFRGQCLMMHEDMKGRLLEEFFVLFPLLLVVIEIYLCAVTIGLCYRNG